MNNFRRCIVLREKRIHIRKIEKNVKMQKNHKWRSNFRNKIQFDSMHFLHWHWCIVSQIFVAILDDIALYHLYIFCEFHYVHIMFILLFICVVAQFFHNLLKLFVIVRWWTVRSNLFTYIRDDVVVVKNVIFSWFNEKKSTCSKLHSNQKRRNFSIIAFDHNDNNIHNLINALV